MAVCQKCDKDAWGYFWGGTCVTALVDGIIYNIDFVLALLNHLVGQ